MSVVDKGDGLTKTAAASPEDVELGASASGTPAPRKRCTPRNIFCYRWWTPVLWVLGILLVGMAIAVPTVLHLKPWQPDDPSFNLDSDNSTYPFVSVDELVELMASEQGVTLIDAREAPAQFSVQAGLGRTIPGAQRATWQDFMNGDDLKSPEAMAQTYRERGVMNDRPVVVYGGWAAENFWGEEGRVWWHLHWLNHSDARVLYGGIWAWNNNIHKGVAISGNTGDFTPEPVADRLISTADVLNLVQTAPDDIYLIDVRGRNEYDGAAPFGSEYGGHIGGAVSYPWRTVFDGDGNLRPLDTIRSEIIALDPRGYDENRQMIVYCTRGVRASFAVASFTGAGFNVTLHEGSWQEWTREVPKALSDSLQAAQG